MANALSQAGATVEPSEFASLAMDEHFTGLWTQRNPLRDADVPYLYRKYYSASRYDSMLDGINREINAKLDDARRPGTSIYNSEIFPSIARFYKFSTFSQSKELVRVIADCNVPLNEVQNGQFANGTSTGWTLGSGWVIATGAPFPPAPGYVGAFVGAGTASITSQIHVLCAPGQLVHASCWALGEPGASGTAHLQLTFFDSGGVQIGSSHTSNPVLNNYIWVQATVSVTAPAGAAWGIVDFTVTGSVGGPRWFATVFYASAGLTSSSSVREVTAPSTNTIIWTKDPAAGRTSFTSVGNILYAGDGVNTHKLITSNLVWSVNGTYKKGDFLVDPNGNLQVNLGVQSATITGISVVNGSYHLVAGQFVQFTLAPTTPLTAHVGQQLIPTGLTTVPSINGDGGIVSNATNSQLITLFYGIFHPPATPQSPETGTLSSGSGISGSTQPAWSTTYGGITNDGGTSWICQGSAAQNWGGAGPDTAPIVTQVAAPSIYPAWSASTWYAPLFVIVDSNGNLQQLTTAGTTGAAHPVWSTTPGATTPEAGPGTAVWTCKGSTAWVASHTYNVGDTVQATYTYYITSTYFDHSVMRWITVSTPVTVTSLFQVTTAGISQTPGPPAWTNGLGTRVTDGSVIWANNGVGPAWPGPSETLSLATQVLDSFQNVQIVQGMGKSGAAAPTWQTALGAFTTGDGTLTWKNSGPYGAANTGAWVWSYSGKNSVTGEITSESPVSQPLVVSANMQAVIQGLGLADTQWDSLILWRTAQGFQAPRIYLDTIPNPGGGQTWIYTDTTPDKLLNPFISAPTADDNNPPPATATAPEYHCGRIWVIDGSYVRYSGGPDTVPGNGNSAFPPLNYYQLPEQPIRLKSVTVQNGGLVVFCVANTYIILGDGTSNNPFLPPRMYMENTGLMSYDAVAVAGSTFHGLSNKSKVFSFDPANGYLETGFPIGDQLTLVTTGGITAALYDPAGAYVTWHEKDSSDTGIYVADGAVGWFRWSPIAPPESGSLWSPRAAIVGGTSAVQSVETAPGMFDLLIGPAASGPIRKRDSGVFADWYAGSYHGYPSWDVKGCISLCDTGEVAEIEHIALKSVAVGSRPIVSLLLDELEAGVTIEGRTTAWDVLSLDEHHEDPPNLDPSITMFSDRYQTSSTAETPKCESLQLKIDYGTQQLPDELLKFAIFGAVLKEKRQQ